MKEQLERIYRGTLVVLAAILIWTVWVSAQESTPAPLNPAAATVLTNEVRKVAGLDQEMLTFGLNRIEVLRTWQPFGQPAWKYVASFIYIVLAFVVSKFLDRAVLVWLKAWAARTTTNLDDLIIELVRGPVKVVSFVIFLHIGLNIFVWPSWLEDAFSKGLKVIVAFSLTYVLIRFVDVLVNHWRKRLQAEADASFNNVLLPIIGKSTKVFIVVVAVLVTSQNMGINITGVLASLSIGGLALGLAAQDTVANFFGAVSVLVDKPFRIGDRIKLAEVDGVVETIGLRSTRVRNLEGHLITVPNKTMGNATITNVTLRPNIKTVMNIGITYDTPTPRVQRALDILSEVYRQSPMTSDVWIAFNQFADSSLNIQVIHWWNSVDYKEYLGGMQAFNLEIKKRFDAEGISFAFPTRTLYLTQVPPIAAGT